MSDVLSSGLLSLNYFMYNARRILGTMGIFGIMMGLFEEYY